MMRAEGTLLEAPAPPTGFYTSEEFLDWLEPGTHADLIAGEIFMHSPVSFQHADLLNFVDRLMAAYIAEKKLGRLYREVVAVKLGARHTFLPDLCFFTNEQVKHLEPTYAPFAPTLVVEVLSPTSENRDRRQKFSAYEAAGVQEYWILDPEHHLHYFYRRHGDRFQQYSKVTEDCVYSESIPGFYLRRSWLFGPDFPDVKTCLAEILLPD